MNKIKWFFMSKYKKLLYKIKQAEDNMDVLVLPNGVKLDFREERKPLFTVTKIDNLVVPIHAEYRLPDFVTRCESPDKVEKHVKDQLATRLALNILQYAKCTSDRNDISGYTKYTADANILLKQ